MMSLVINDLFVVKLFTITFRRPTVDVFTVQAIYLVFNSIKQCFMFLVLSKYGMLQVLIVRVTQYRCCRCSHIT